MPTRNAPLSPASIGEDDWLGYSPHDKAGPYPTTRPLATPPVSGGSISSMNGFPPPRASAGGPSPPASVARSSNGTNIYSRAESMSGRSFREENAEGILGEHYVALKRFLAAAARNDKNPPPVNKARDKLQRLTSVQFLELSTDVFDELLRRQAFARKPPNAPPNAGPPAYLLPEETFHPKRNQARQKLSSLGPPRFRDLATDVFCELERRFPQFAAGDIPRMGSPASFRAPSRVGTPGNGPGFAPRGQGRRHPSEAGSIRSMRSGMGGPLNSAYGSIPPSPGMPPNGYDRPLPKQSQTNMIVPNKSTMVEEDDDALSPVGDLGLGPYGVNGRGGDRSRAQSETDKRMIDDYEMQVKELREKMDAMEDALKKKDDELSSLRDRENTKVDAANLEKQEFVDIRRSLESQLSDAQSLNESLREELERLRDEHASEARELREQLEDAQTSGVMHGGQANHPEAERENQELRAQLREQQDITEDVRQTAQEALAEMRMLSEQSSAAWEKQSELEKLVESLEQEVRDWRNRYARTKTQLRNMRASSMGLTIDQDAGRYVQERGFTTDSGLVKDVHVTKFQISIDEFLRRIRVDEPDKAIDSMKAVVVGVRRITKDIDDSAPSGEGLTSQQHKLKGRVSSTANNLITASKNFSAAAGLSPVSLVDAAASHLVAAVVELLRTVKIRATPAGELEDDDDGSLTPVDSTGFFSPPKSNGHSRSLSTATSARESLPPPPPFRGLGGNRDSATSSAYSPISSPRESVDRYGVKRPISRGSGLSNGMGYLGIDKGLSSAPNGNGYGVSEADRRAEDLKIYLEDQTAVMVQSIQQLVSAIRGDADIDEITGQINDIAEIVGKVVNQTSSTGFSGGQQQQLDRLSTCRQRLLEAADSGEDLAADGKGPADREWRMWTQTLPPIAFEIARESKELVQRIDRLVMANGDGTDDFS